MADNLTCVQVGALLPFYIDDKLSLHLKHFVEAHLQNCPKCRVKYEALQKMIYSLRKSHENVNSEDFDMNENGVSSELQTNLSAYVDNELNEIESVRLKKQIISNPKVRSELESMCLTQKLLSTSFEKEENDFKDDYSRLIFNKIDAFEDVNMPDPFVKHFMILTSSLILLMVGALFIFMH